MQADNPVTGSPSGIQTDETKPTEKPTYSMKADYPETRPSYIKHTIYLVHQKAQINGKTDQLHEGGLPGDRVLVQRTIARRPKVTNRRHGTENNATAQPKRNRRNRPNEADGKPYLLHEGGLSGDRVLQHTIA